MGLKVLITRPEFDVPTFYLSKWSKYIIKECRSKGTELLDLSKSRSNREEVESMIESHQPNLLVFNGHGDENTIFGHKNKPIIDEKNLGILKEKIVYTIACKAAKNLGKIAVKNGTKCFIGYSEKFTFIRNPEMVSRPLKDGYAKPFFMSTNKIPISLIKGNTAGESIDRAKNEFRKWMIRIRAEDQIPENDWILRALLWDISSLTLLGEKNYTI